jgi:hypothetical protein
MHLDVWPCELKDANAFVELLHRHHPKVLNHRFSIRVVDNSGWTRGVVTVGRPVARKTDQRNIVEVTRLCTDGVRNGCSILYAAAARAAREIGYWKIQTFILDTETGTSLKAAGWSYEGMSFGRDGWHSRSGRSNKAPNVPKQRWSKVLRSERPGLNVRARILRVF